MAQTDVYVKNLSNPDWAQTAELTAACKDREGFLILDAESYIIRAHLTEKETRDIALKFHPPSP